MKCKFWSAAVAAVLSVVGATAAQAAVLYSENFSVDPTAAWTVNNNNNGVNAANLYFDYSTVGIPAAPRTTDGSTRGMKLQANIGGTTADSTKALPAINASPTGKAFSGDYELRFDWWHNWLGAATGGIGNAAGGSGSTQLSMLGIMTSGATTQSPGAVDGVTFAATGDGGATADYRAYSSHRQAGYAVVAADTPFLTYAAGSQANTASLYTTLFPAGASAPTAQTSIPGSTQGGLTVAGTAGFRWHDVRIKKTGDIVTWTINNTLIATLDMTNIANKPTGANILFGHSDTSYGAGTPAAMFALLDFTLIDNIVVTNSAIPEPSSLALCGVGLVALAARRRRNA